MGATLLDVPLFDRMAQHSQAALDRLFAHCEADGACRQAFPDLEGTFRRLRERLDDEPVPTYVTNPINGEKIMVTNEVLATVVHNRLLDARAAAELPRLLYRAHALEVWEPIARDYASYLELGRDQLVMMRVIFCSEPWAAFSPRTALETGDGSYYLSTLLKNRTEIGAACDVLHSSEPGACYSPTRSSQVPVLFINGDSDPQDPPANVVGASELWPRSLALTLPNEGHVFTQWECVLAVIKDFLQQGTVEELEMGCTRRLEPPAFSTRP